MTPLMSIEDPPAPAPRRFALWDLGFRPFYMLASAFAALSIPLWSLQFSGVLGYSYLSGPLWHAHEMVFGFTLAVVVGFLLTAGRNWSNQPTPTGLKLAALATLWMAGRVLVLTPFETAAAAVNIAFPLAVALALAVPFFKARIRRNYFFIGLLVLLSLAAAVVHLSRLGAATLPVSLGIPLALDIVLFMLAVMGGRVIPMFTNNGVPGANATRRPRVERAALGSVLALMAADAAGLQGWPLAAIASAGCVFHAWRWALWQPQRTLRVPLVWILHLAYVWVPIHLGLRALAEFGLVVPSVASHALTVGAVGGLVIGMMTRTALGHTARPLRASRIDAACYGLVLAAAVVRVAVPVVAPAATLDAVMASATLWSAAFALYAIRYWPILSRPRLDGRPG